MVQVKWSKQAIEDITAISSFYNKVSPHFANNLVNQIFSKEKMIAAFPEMGRIVPELNNVSVRELIFNNYRIIYAIFDELNISVLTIHASSKPLSQISLFE